MQAPNTGLVFSTDSRDKEFVFSKVSRDIPPITEKMWWDNGWWGNQGNTPHCCAYAWTHFMEDGPVVQDVIVNRPVPLFKPDAFFDACKKIDGLPSTSKGTTIRAGAKIAKEIGLISEYRWAESVNDVVEALLVFGPVIAGLMWYQDMDAPKNGLMRATGPVNGGHAFIINGVDTVKEQVRIKNSYGKSWGKGGYGYLPFKELEKLMKEAGLGSVVIPFESKLSIIPTL